jgi:hypothetical protein
MGHVTGGQSNWGLSNRETKWPVDKVTGDKVTGYKMIGEKTDWGTKWPGSSDQNKVTGDKVTGDKV